MIAVLLYPGQGPSVYVMYLLVPHFRKKAEKLEIAQGRATRMVKYFWSRSNERTS